MSDLAFQHIDFSYTKDQELLVDFTLDIAAGEFVFLLGANGSGKTTLLKLILGVLQAQKGKILWGDIPMPASTSRSSFIGYVPQSYSLDPEMSVADILDMIGSLHRLSPGQARERKQELIAALRMDSFLKQRVKRISGGQKQRLNIALGLLHNPEVLLLDEPFVGLDYGIKSRVISYLKQLKKTIICISHDLELAENTADKILLIKNGKIKAYQSPKEMVEEEAFVMKEIDFKQKVNVEPQLGEEIRCTLQQNRIIVAHRDRADLLERVAIFLKENQDQIVSVRSYQNNLRSSLVGRYNFSLSHGRRKNNKNKKGNRKNK